MSSMYRMPVGFGPSLGPRQGPDGRRFTGEVSRATLASTTFVTDPDAMARLLPRGFTPAEDPTVTVRMHWNRDMSWLAGRAYHYVEVVFAATYEGREDRVEGDFVAVMWESLADPIIVGREEAGHPKLFADITEPTVRDGSTRGAASWFDFTFLEMEFDGLELGPWPTDREQSVEPSRSPAGHGSRPRLNYKYFPSCAELDRPEVEYVTMFPAGLYEQRVLERWTGTGRTTFTEARWEDLPTFAQVVNGLAGLEVREWREASMVRLLRGFNDLRDDMRVLS